MYADDHNPPHFHVVGADVQVIVGIADLVVMAGDARRGQLDEALAWAREHRAELMLSWNELNRRG